MSKDNLEYNPELLEKLKNTVITAYGKSVITTYDTQLLAEDIKLKIKTPINYNTLRRFFKIVRSDTQPSIFTVNALSNYIGFTDWDTFCYKTQVNEQNQLFDILLVFKHTQKIDEQLVSKLAEKYGHQTQFHYFLREVISLAYQTKNYLFFKNIFKLKIAFDIKVTSQVNIYYTVHSIALFVRKNKILQDIAINDYSKLGIKENYYVEYFVDVEQINGYYGKVLDNYIKQKKDKQAILFYNCMKFYGAYFKKNTPQMIQCFKYIKKIKNYNGIYSIPIARKRVCELLIEVLIKKNKPTYLVRAITADINYLKVTYNSLDVLVDYFAYLSQGLFWGKQFEMIVKLTDEYLLINSMQTSHLKTNSFNFLKLYYAISLFKLKQYSKANEFIKSVDPKKFNIYQFEILNKDYNYYFKIISKSALSF